MFGRRKAHDPEDLLCLQLFIQAQNTGYRIHLEPTPFNRSILLFRREYKLRSSEEVKKARLVLTIDEMMERIWDKHFMYAHLTCAGNQIPKQDNALCVHYYDDAQDVYSVAVPGIHYEKNPGHKMKRDRTSD